MIIVTLSEISQSNSTLERHCPSHLKITSLSFDRFIGMIPNIVNTFPAHVPKKIDKIACTGRHFRKPYLSFRKLYRA